MTGFNTGNDQFLGDPVYSLDKLCVSDGRRPARVNVDDGSMFGLFTREVADLLDDVHCNA